MNETLCPLDFRSAGEIVDDELNRLLVNPLPTVGSPGGAWLGAWTGVCLRPMHRRWAGGGFCGKGRWGLTVGAGCPRSPAPVPGGAAAGIRACSSGPLSRPHGSPRLFF
jgi:hypothetical protein